MSSEEKKRRKGKNFSDQEISLLITLIEEQIDIVENKKIDGTTVKMKNNVWADITYKFNAANINDERSTNQLKMCYDNYKRKIRKDSADDKVLLIYSLNFLKFFNKLL